MSEKTNHTPGPWQWEFNAEHKTVCLVGGVPTYDKTVMGFSRWGMNRAAPMFRDTSEDGFNLLHKLHERGDWISPFRGREHHAHWCSNINHPDARLIAAAPELLEALIELAEYANGFSVSGVYLNDEIEGSRLLKKSFGAISKATGE